MNGDKRLRVLLEDAIRNCPALDENGYVCLKADILREVGKVLAATQEQHGEPGLTEDEHTTARHLKTCAVRRELPTWAEIECAADALLARHTGSYVAVSSSERDAQS